VLISILSASCAGNASHTRATLASKEPDPRSPRSDTRAACPSDDDTEVAPTPTNTDLAVLRRADDLLSAPSAWSHAGDRECEPAARSFNLYCALHRASIDVVGVACHRSAALQEVRWIVDERTRGVDLAHRLMDYNNLPTTTFTDIKSALRDAIDRLSKELPKEVGGESAR
jgi:hypothetical protein